MNAWTALRSAMQDDGTQARFSKATLRRVLVFARPHRRTIVAFLLLATVGAVLGVAIPILAGQAVDVIVNDGATASVVRLALLIAAIAVAGSVVGLLGRLESSRLGEGLILDLRQKVFEHVRW